jgi:hypothetical protein
MNTQLIESLVETIRALSPAEQTILWQKLDHSPTTENILLQKIAQTLPTSIQHSKKLSVEREDFVNTVNVRWTIHHNLSPANTSSLLPKVEKHR